MTAQGINVCVFCGASPGNDNVFMKTATEVGERIARAGYGLVYGAGGVGMMGAVSDGALSENGYVFGAIPKKMMDREWGRKDITELKVTADIHERKKVLYERSSVFVTLPGGFGTLDEFFESLTWSQLKYHEKQSIILNINGYYDPLEQLVNTAFASEFVRPDDRKLVQFVSSVDDMMDVLKTIR